MQNRSWNALIATLPDPHVLQSMEWGDVKSRFGWQPSYYIWTEQNTAHIPEQLEKGAPTSVNNCTAAALILQRTVKFAGLSWRVLYVPKGPLLDWENQELLQRVLLGLASLAQRKQAIFIKIDPDVSLGRGLAGQINACEDPTGQAVVSKMSRMGWRQSDEQIQFQNTATLDLSLSDEQLLANMKQKTRYNLRLAERKGVLIRAGSARDIPLLYHMYAETSVRDGFVIRDQSYYEILWSTFFQAGLAEPLIAEVEGEAVAALILFYFARKAWYMSGMSRQVHRDKMPNYLLQWEAIRRAKTRACLVYDLWGAPNTLDENDPLWGVYRFKDGLGGQVIRHIGAWDLPVKPNVYRLYTQTLPRILNLMRTRGQSRTRQQLGI